MRASAQQQERIRPGQVVARGRYVLLEELGRGGLATVFRARDTGDGSEVALKVLCDRYVGRPEREERLRRELDRAVRAERENAANPVDEETRRKLSSLGYVASAPKKNPGGLPDPKDRVEVFDRTEKLLAKGVPRETQLRGFREILALEPDNVLAQKRIAGLLADEGRLEDAVVEYQKLLRIAEFDARLAPLRDVLGVLFGVRRGEPATGIAGACDKAGTDRGRLGGKAERFDRAFGGGEFVRGHAGDQQVLPDRQTDIAVTHVLCDRGKAAHLRRS